jgi:hypothetical protein
MLPYQWSNDRRFDIDIVGESHYQTAISKIAAQHADTIDPVIYAFLVPEDHNKHDNKAILVVIGLETVGYLDADDAREFRKRLSRKKLAGQITICEAALTGGHIKRDGSKAMYGVKLDMKEFEY